MGMDQAAAGVRIYLGTNWVHSLFPLSYKIWVRHGGGAVKPISCPIPLTVCPPSPDATRKSYRPGSVEPWIDPLNAFEDIASTEVKFGASEGLEYPQGVTGVCSLPS